MCFSLVVHGIALSAWYMFRHQPDRAHAGFNPDRVLELVVLSEPVGMPKPAAAKIVSKAIPKPMATQPRAEIRPAIIQNPDPMPMPAVATVVREEPISQAQDILESPTASEPVNSGVSTKAETPPASTDAGSPANYLSNPRPLYPAECRRRKEEGLVLLAVRVSQDGLPDRIQIVQSSRYPMLDEAAVKAVGRWRFTPARFGEKTVTSTIEIPIRFKLTASK